MGVWSATRWIPGPPRRNAGVRSLMRFGGTLTLNGLVVYIAYNLEKVLLGRFWGAEAIGIYGRAYQLIRTPTDNLNSSIGEVAFAALSRVQDDRSRFRNYFLKGYSLVLAMTIPITVMCAFFANDLIAVLLGPKWNSVAPIFSLLAPTILVLAIINPLGWLMFALGLVDRSLKTALVLAPIVITGYLVGLHYGPRGVAFGYSAVMLLWAIPHTAWCIHGTGVSLRDVLVTVSRPLVSGLGAALIAFVVHHLTLPFLSTFPRLLAEGLTLMIVYTLILFYGMGQKALYLDVFRGFRKRAPQVEEDTRMVPA
jgi:O-antigen/teichoic acid export membrane protein